MMLTTPSAIPSEAPAPQEQPAKDGPARRQPVPRGLSRSGPALFSYGFRPFFLGGALFAALAMALWLNALAGGSAPGGSLGGAHWHAHEMIFGFGSAILTGFLLTAIPNWTGRLPLAGPRLIGLFGLWLIARLAMIDPDRLGLTATAALDLGYFAALLFVTAREVTAGRNFKNLKIVVGILLLMLADAAFFRAMLAGEHPALSFRLGIAAYVLLVTIVGGRIIPSFTRNALAKRKGAALPVPFGRFDVLAIAAGALALGIFAAGFDGLLLSLLAGAACLLQAVRLCRWRGLGVIGDPLLFILHVAYGLVVAGFGLLLLCGLDIVDEAAVLHGFGLGAAATMMLAVMTRAARGHTGRALVASRLTVLSYGCLILAAVLRVSAEVIDTVRDPLILAAGLAFIAAFGLYAAEHFPMLAFRRRPLL